MGDPLLIVEDLHESSTVQAVAIGIEARQNQILRPDDFCARWRNRGIQLFRVSLTDHG